MTTTRRRAPRAWWLRALLLAALAGAGWYGWRSFAPHPPPPPPPSGEAAPADITQTVQAAGVLQPRVKVDVGAQVSGQVQKIHVELGQGGKKGDLLLRRLLNAVALQRALVADGTTAEATT
jgi:macrolide-specific efflux system membrane fusion protein